MATIYSIKRTSDDKYVKSVDPLLLSDSIESAKVYEESQSETCDSDAENLSISEGEEFLRIGRPDDRHPR